MFHHRRGVSLLLVVLAVVASSSTAQFTCTFAGASDADSCTAVVDDGKEHCAWCTLTGTQHKDAMARTMTIRGSISKYPVVTITDFGFCVSESQAEAMEKSIPNVHCDRYSGNTDDTTPSTDDAAPPPSDDQPYTTDDTEPSTDDQAPPTDDQAPENDDRTPLPDDYWTCLQRKNEVNCTAADCTWCNSKSGYGVCMTGPTAESASNSAWYTCTGPNRTTTTIRSATEESLDKSSLLLPAAPDPACVVAYITSPTEQGCVSTVDANGNPCEWCSILDLTHVCLTSEEAIAGAAMGVACDATAGITSVRTTTTTKAVKDPYDPSCLMAYLTDSTKEACLAATDADGAPCEFCTLQGALDMCLNAEQAQDAAPLGVQCDTTSAAATTTTKTVTASNSQYDLSCLVSYIEDPTESSCMATMGADGHPCEYCNLAGVLPICLTSDQADMTSALGVACHPGADDVATPHHEKDIYDPTCLMAYLTDATESSCVAAVDDDGNNCEYCSLPGAFDLCLTADQAEMAEEAIGMTCAEHQLVVASASSVVDAPSDPYDPSCLLAYLADASEESCKSAVDADGTACEFCSLQGAFDLCLTSEQAEIGEQAIGITCDDGQKQLDDDDEVVVVGSVVRLPALKSSIVEDVFDTSCLEAFFMDQSEESCVAANDQTGTACLYCSLPNSLVLCLTSDQAEIGQSLGMDCSTSTKLLTPDNVLAAME